MGALVAALLLGGCAGTPMTDRLTQSPPDGLPAQIELTDTPFFPQTAYYCGPATMAALLEGTGLETTPEAIAGALFTPGRSGTLQSDVIAAARRNGRLAIRVDGMLDAFAEVADGRPILILQNLGLSIAPQWHYALLIGYDLDRKQAILRSGTTRRLVNDLSLLEYTWARGDFWGISVNRPEGPVPATATLTDWMGEAAGVERAGRHQSAATAYLTAARHWPTAAQPWLALGNLEFSAGDLAQSEAALRNAVQRAPDNDAALNNLAYVLLRRDQRDEAEATARRAIALDGPNRAEAEATLAEILGD
jgi:tetratricopeptide (TPR) repeat protein